MLRKKVARTKAGILKDIKLHPNKHRHNLNDLIICCTIDGIVIFSLIGVHQEYVDLGVSGGIKCDVIGGLCACRGWH
ncbi:MAG: hypothetical protein A2745_02510 [Candidatus Harrisonbacteria bacterium RIFCSPHIGHO2_01_FULL_44_13]|uniref:Uncharacterized protein n=1 Tax=Candidatus Harrisonbacteria bacterium RIFCSPLOWO2_01_FULL_44_18 TaxID=1798407 RepID=A0A1G1ZMP9_9BACT|nr:MAG: hypothetical protein A2745_02510 [Candidatus Harrisonbacteria bacterium RIFCSPHIGHO2_01_FULL_44_13]OGY65831.1 MAG: hypothetical protein A3A16_02065 [Candidatus Harrisonbacteria bacterium RIFCSPLOWO2_01_FULL_44_18]